MKRQTPIPTQKENMPPQMRGLSSHAAVHNAREHELPTNVSVETQFDHDLSRVSVQPSTPGFGQDNSNVACPLLPQRCPLGGACHTCPPRVQAKIKIGQPGDKYEQEADRVAEQVTTIPESVCFECMDENSQGLQINSLTQESTHQVQRQTSFPPDAKERMEEERVQLKAKSVQMYLEVAPAIEHRLNAMSDSGQKMPSSIRRYMTRRFGANFDDVRVHSDNNAGQISRSLNAEAFTYKNHIYFGDNRLNYSTHSGKKLLAHELTHTLQQQGIQRNIVQRRGGTTVGEFGVHTNAVDQGLIAGHAWLSYTPNAGSMTTYGTWGNRTPIGLHRNLELSYTPAASRTTNIDSTDRSNLTAFVGTNNDWGYINNCASFAARGWYAVTGESLSHTTWSIPNPSALGSGIVAANGGAPTSTMVGEGTGASSSHGSSGSSAGSSGHSSTGLSSGSSSSSL